MPCGGIYPLEPGSGVSDFVPKDSPCWVCQKPGVTHFCDEWDTGLHAHCVVEFLASEEGQIVISHQHSVLIDFSLE